MLRGVPAAGGADVSQILVLDNVDDRRELHSLLHRLPPAQRLAFLKYCCSQVPKTNSNRLPEPAVWKMRATMEMAYRCEKASEVLTNEIYCDILTLFNSFSLDAMATATALERLVRALRV